METTREPNHIEAFEKSFTAIQLMVSLEMARNPRNLTDHIKLVVLATPKIKFIRESEEEAG